MEITKAQFQEWKNNSVTQEVLEQITQLRNDLSEFLANGGTLNPQSPVTTEFVVGRIQGLNELLSIEYEESTDEIRDAYGH